MSMQPDPNLRPEPVSASAVPGGSSTGDEPTRVGDSRTGGGSAAGVPLGPSIEGYLLKEEIHRGGQGVVYRAVQLGTKRQVALKVLLEGPYASETARRRFEREIELAASLRHPNIVTILDSGLSLGRYFFAMEYIEGIRLDRWLAQHRPPLEATLRLFERVATAVNFAHQRGVIHRDLKPPNILIDAEGEPRILDFGLAKPVHTLAGGESTVQMLSLSGQLLGTVAYMSPEQAAGHQDVDVRSDVYSLGVIFYEALVGQPPYPVEGPLGEVLRRITHDEPANPRTLARQTRAPLTLDDELATIVLKSLEKEPQRRYQTAGELARDIRHLLAGEPIEAKRASGMYMLRKTLRRYRLEAATAGLILLMLVGFLITFAVLFTSERAERQRADQKAGEARESQVALEDALARVRASAVEATLAQQSLRRSLVRQHIQRGDLALEQSDYREARDAYWRAFEVAPGPPALWALRRYYLQSPDDGATLLSLGPSGLYRLAPGARLAASATGQGSIAVQPLTEPGATRWLRAPGPVTLIDIQDDGSVAAVGDGNWGRVWEPGAVQPSVAITLSEAGPPLAVFAVGGGRAAAVLGPRQVRIFSGEAGDGSRLVGLRGAPTGAAAYAPAAEFLAVPTTAGLELVPTGSGPAAAQAELAWTGSTTARAVRVAGDTLAVLADALYVAPLNSTRPRAWTRRLAAAPDWELFDLRPAGDTVVFARRDGRVAVHRGGELLGTWQPRGERIDQVLVADDDGTFVTLNPGGLVARWAPPVRIEQRRLVHDSEPVEWAAAADGTTVLLAGSRGQVLAYTPGQSPQPRTILRPRLIDLGAGGLALAVSANGRRAVIRDRAIIRLVELADLATQSFQWSDPRLTVPDQVALSSDGARVAVLARSPAGDQQRIELWQWPARGTEPAAARKTGELPFVGALVRELAFVPGTHELLVVRSSGQILALDTAQPGAPAVSAWAELESPATRIAFSRSGDYLAVACEDHILRILSVPRREVRHRVAMTAGVAALDFNPRDEVLLTRTEDGVVRLYEPATGERIAAWPLRARGTRPHAAWIGTEADAMLLAYDGGLHEYRYAEADKLIDRNRAYARQQQVARALADADFDTAWTAATDLRALSPQRGREAQLAVATASLRRPNLLCPSECFDAVQLDAPADVCVALGHAAYDGERFEQARTWLARGRELAAGRVDALTDWRIAQCDYLRGNFAAAAAGLDEVLKRPDLEPGDAPLVALQRVSALLLGGDLPAARQLAARIRMQETRRPQRDLVAVTYASVIARVITGTERESSAATLFDSLVGSFGERPLLFRDDQHFFAGELARHRGEDEAAAVEYQRCIDLARDAWPANWARHRLRQLADGALPVVTPRSAPEGSAATEVNPREAT